MGSADANGGIEDGWNFTSSNMHFYNGANEMAYISTLNSGGIMKLGYSTNAGRITLKASGDSSGTYSEIGLTNPNGSHQQVFLKALDNSTALELYDENGYPGTSPHVNKIGIYSQSGNKSHINIRDDNGDIVIELGVG